MLAHKTTSTWLFFTTAWILLPSFAQRFHQVFFYKQKGVYFASYAFKTEHTSSEIECCSYCLQETWCASANYKTSGDYQGLCDLNVETMENFPQNGIKNSEFYYFKKLNVQVNLNSIGKRQRNKLRQEYTSFLSPNWCSMPSTRNLFLPFRLCPMR